MRQKLFNFNNRFFKLLFYFFITITFYFALTSSNLILGDNHITKIGTTWFTTYVLIAAFLFGLLIYASENVRDFLAFIFIDRRWITASCCLAIAILIQIGFILLIHSPVADDVGVVHQVLLTPKSPNIVGYFSVNPNNLGIALFQKFLADTFHTTSWLFFEMATLIIIDIAALFNLLSIAVIDKNKLPIGMYIHALWIISFPAILIPYTDTWVVGFVAIYIFCYCLIAYSNTNKFIKSFFALVMGFNIVCAYIIKPSGIIPAIAIVIIEGLNLLSNHKKQWWWIVLVSALLVGSTAGSYYKLNQTIKNQKYVTVYYFRAKPMVHFINMGLSGDGGYNAKDSMKMVTTINKQDRINYSVNSIKKRLHKMGFSGYLAFLWRKQNNNAADGTFGYLREGDASPMKHKPDKHGFRGKVENFFLLYGNNVGDFRYFTQIWWCIWLGLIFFAWNDDRKIMQVMRVSLIGGFIFLLIFEGGRSRYLIQFLPVFLLLATLGSTASSEKLRSLFSWTKIS